MRSALGTIGIEQIERVTDKEIKSLDHIMHVEVPALRRRAAPVHSRAPTGTAVEGAVRDDAAGSKRPSDVEGGGGADEGAGATRAPDSSPQPDRHGSSSATNA